jgi:transglutaminase-like putative cysteine protease
MRLRIEHETSYAYETPATRTVQILRLTPRGHDGQFVINWRIDVDHDCRLEATNDPFGNKVHSFSLEGPLESLTITASGEVETLDTHGVVSGQMERFPATLFLRDTPLTTPDRAIRAMAEGAARRGGSDQLAVLHELMNDIRGKMRFDVDGETHSQTSAREALALGHGVCQDFAHVFIAAARHLNMPARYVGGYLYQADMMAEQTAGHAWAEAKVNDLGWVGFDPANGICPTDGHVRVATGLDYLGAAPVRGTRFGGTGEILTVKVSVRPLGKPQIRENSYVS